MSCAKNFGELKASGNASKAAQFTPCAGPPTRLGRGENLGPSAPFRIPLGNRFQILQSVGGAFNDGGVLAQEAFEVGGGGDGLIEARVGAFGVGAERDEIALFLVGCQERAGALRGGLLGFRGDVRHHSG